MPKNAASKLSSLPKPSTASSQAVPLLDLSRGYSSVRGEILAAVERVCDSQHFILGKEVEAFEQEASAFLGVKETIASASGTDAIWLALMASGVGPGDSVLTTPFSFFATASAIIRAGARPVFVDIDPNTLNLDPQQASLYARSANVKAVLPVHLYGQCADSDALDEISRATKVPIIEDAAQAFGAAWRGRRAGGLGLAAAFSFYPTKNLSAFGDAGCVTTNDPEIAARLRRLRNHGSSRRYYHEEFGWNSRMDAIQAAVLRVKLKHIEDWNARRRNAASTYDTLFQSSGLAAGSLSPVLLPATRAESFHIFHQYVIRVRERDQLRAFLAEHKIGTEIYYPLPLHLQASLAYLGHAEGDFPEAELAAKEVLALPMFPELTQAEQEAVVNSIASFYS